MSQGDENTDEKQDLAKPEPFVSDAVRDVLEEPELEELARAEAIAMGRAPEAPPFEPKPEEDLGEDTTEFGEPDGTGVHELSDNDVNPYVVTMTFHGASRRDDESEENFFSVVQAVIDEAEKRGLYHYHTTAGVIGVEKLGPTTDIYKAVTGRE